MKNFVFISLFVVLRCSSQNLVPNSSFETVANCNFPLGAVSSGYVFPWDSPTNGTPDLYNTCTSTWAVPNCYLGYQQARTGDGFVGLGLYEANTIVYKEYIQISLDSPMVSGQKYCASFYVNLANTLRLACNNFGMYFSDTHTYIPTTDTIGFTPEINNATIITDTSSWTLIYGQYTAHGGERYIVIGNFYSDNFTDTIHVHGNDSTISEAYYYIDDVNVHCCTCDSVNIGVGEIGSRNEELEIYPNPSEGKFTIELKGEGMAEVYNVIGEVVLTTKITKEKTEMDIGDLPKGMYFVQVKNEKGIFNKKIIKQ